MLLLTDYMNSHKLKFNFKKTEYLLLLLRQKTHDKHKQLVLRMNGQVVQQKKVVRLLGLYITYNMDQKHYIKQMKNNLMSFLSQRFAVLTMMTERVCIKKQKAASIWSDYFEADFWDTILDFGMLRDVCCHTFGVVTFMFSLSWVNVPAPQKIRLHVMW